MNALAYKYREFKVGLIVAHTAEAQGAKAKDGTLTEFMYSKGLCKETGLPYAIKSFGGHYPATRELVDQGCNVIIEPHCNAYNGSVRGAEILVMHGDHNSTRVAKMLIELFKIHFPDRRLRGRDGIKVVHKGDRGWSNLKRIGEFKEVKIKMLTEFFFIDNLDDYIDPRKLAVMLKEFDEILS